MSMPADDPGAAALGIRLAPDLSRPLALWNPLDYLKLLYWALFFPQAIRGYEVAWVAAEHQDAKGIGLASAILADTVLRQLCLQALTLMLAAPAVFGYFAQATRLPWDWPAAVLGIAYCVALCMALSSGRGVAFGVALCTAGGVIFGVAGGVAFGVAGKGAFGVVPGVALGVALGLALGMIAVVASCVVGGVVDVVARMAVVGVTLAVALGVTLGVVLSVAGGEAGGLAGGVAGGTAGGMAIGVVALRIPDWLISRIVLEAVISRTSPLPQSKIGRSAAAAFDRSWAEGLSAGRYLLRWTLQFWVVVSEINDRLATAPEGQLIPRVRDLAEGAYSKELLRFGSVNLRNAMAHRFIDGLFPIIFRRSWRQALKTRYPMRLRFDTAPRAACAGFFYWHCRYAEPARDAFSHVRHLLHGAELFAVADGLVRASAVETWGALGEWQIPMAKQESPLRPGVLRAMAELSSSAEAVSRAVSSESQALRRESMGRALGHLQALLDEGPSYCENPEWPLVEQVAEHWRDLVSRAIGQAAEAAQREPVENPFVGYSGRPVRGHAFVGRIGAFATLQKYLGSRSSPAIFVYGHRRMGKTSILVNLDGRLGNEVLAVYLDMQGLAKDGTHDLFFDITRAIHRRLAPEGLDLSEPDSAGFWDPASARRSFEDYLRDLAPKMGSRRLLLAFDEFETLSRGFETQRLDHRLLELLRSLQNELPWLSLVFAGLHTLEEMNREYWSPFFAQHEHIRVSYLSRADTFDLLRRPDDTFNLELEEELLNELYRLTYGQPYLTQRLAWELVEAWNERFLSELEPIPRVLRREDLDPLLSSELFVAADYYFDGLWRQLDTEEQALVQLMSRRSESWPAQQLGRESRGIDLSATLERLERHDVILVESGPSEPSIGFAAELFRQWVVQRGDGLILG